MLPASLRGELIEQLERVADRWRADLTRGGGFAPVPVALAHRRPTAGRELPFQFVFPSTVLRYGPDGLGRRWHADPSALDRAVVRAARAARVPKRVTCHT